MKLLYTLALISCYPAFSQVGINNSNPSKMLHVRTTAANDGLRLDAPNMYADFRLNGTDLTLLNSINSGTFTYAFGSNDKLIIGNSQFYPAVNSADNTNSTGYDLGIFSRHFRRVYTQGIHTNDNSATGGLRINIGSSGNTVADYMFSDFAMYPVEGNLKDLGRNGNGWRNFFFQSAFNTSDRRLKTDIKNLELGVEMISKLKTYEYTFKADPSQNIHYGLMAQDLQEQLPALVAVGDNEEQSLAVNYTELIPIIINAVQEQQKQIADLKAEIEVLKK